MDYWPSIAVTDVFVGGLKKVRILYRVRQFWHNLTATPTLEEITDINHVLSAPLMDLFFTLQPSEQAHSLWIYHELLEQGEAHQDLLVAALLHDVGKNRYPLRLWQRVIIVMGTSLFPERVKHWRLDDTCSWKRSFVVAERHAAWGAEMAKYAGASPTTVKLIKHHHDPMKSPSIQREDQLLCRLQLLDDRS
jgi:hypothetical protein